jgi:hypothetical protein
VEHADEVRLVKHAALDPFAKGRSSG